LVGLSTNWLCSRNKWCSVLQNDRLLWRIFFRIYQHSIRDSWRNNHP